MLAIVGKSSGAQERFPQLRYLGARRETPTVVTFRFRDHEEFAEHQPGQYCSIWMKDVTDPRGPSRLFSISSSPTEKGHITVTTRLRGSPFKQRLLTAQPGENFQVRGPFGEFVLDNNRPAVMLAGGIGITPFRSMIKYAADTGLSQPIVLLYSNRTAEEIVFREELERLSHTFRSFKMVTTITRPEESKVAWQGHTGRINGPKIKNEVDGLSDPLFYVCGPPQMVEEMTGTLTQNVGVQLEDIREERFDGY